MLPSGLSFDFSAASFSAASFLVFAIALNKATTAKNRNEKRNEKISVIARSFQ